MVGPADYRGGGKTGKPQPRARAFALARRVLSDYAERVKRGACLPLRGSVLVETEKSHYGAPDPDADSGTGLAEEGRTVVDGDALSTPADRSPPPEEAPLPPPGGDGLALGAVSPPAAPPPAPREAPAPTPPTRTSSLSLEERVRRLEDALAALQQQHSLTTLHPAEPTEPAPPEADSLAGVLATTGRRLLLSGDAAPAGTAPALVEGRRWLPFEMLAELRAMLRMIFDPRYRMTLQARVIPPLVLLAMFFNWWIVGSFPVLGWLVERIFLVLLSYVLFKVLAREATRYRLTSPDIPPSLRL